MKIWGIFGLLRHIAIFDNNNPEIDLHKKYFTLT